MVHQRWYTNGDIVRLDVHGNVLNLGKGDKQIQLAGKLLDLGEVNATLLKSNIDCGSCSASILEAVNWHISLYLMEINIGGHQILQRRLYSTFTVYSDYRTAYSCFDKVGS